jgi:hypothetical protein
MAHQAKTRTRRRSKAIRNLAVSDERADGVVGGDKAAATKPTTTQKPETYMTVTLENTLISSY